MTTPFPAQPPADSGAPVTASQPPATTPTDEPSGGEQRLDAELVRRGLARSRGQAVALVKSGAVSVSGAVVRRASVVVSAESPITVEADAEDPGFVSRAGFKLDGVLVALGEDGPAVAGVDCLDVGASTGGFTDVLLRRGAKSVVALDVGHGQLVEPLRSDPRVHVVERFNARELTTEVLPVAPGLVVADISFISLTMVLPAVVASVPTGAELLLMVKPQFEVGREHLGSGGVVRDTALHARAVRGVVDAAVALGFGPRAIIPSPLPGPNGNREFFVWFSRAAEQMSVSDDTIGRAVGQPVEAGAAVTWVTAADVAVTWQTAPDADPAGGRS